jgi:hypothetical protein
MYKASPTLSYRKNKVGINYNFPSGNSLTEPSFVVGSHEGAQYIYFYHPDNTIAIDLETGSIDSSILDCGSWSGVQGGFASFKSDLADIAYSGDIADLHQRINPENPVTIVITGNS